MSVDAHALAREAAAILGETLRAELHLPGAREKHRRQLGRVIELAQLALDTCGDGARAAATVERALSSLVRAHAARAKDACHGANQLSQSAQRAPTRDACNDGWQRVEQIAAVAEASSKEATRFATELSADTAWKVAQLAEAMALDARRIVDERNHAYTFHTDPSFSFGEGWYAAAAASVDTVMIQVEPDKPQTAQAERFLRDAGLSHRLLPYRPRPRANKHLPEIVASAFRADPMGVQRQLRAAFLGEAEIPRAIMDWADGKLAAAPKKKRTVLLWLRYSAHHPMRNTTYAELVQLAQRIVALGLVPILVGDALRDGEVPPGSVDMTLFWKLPIFQGADMRRAQLQLFEHLRNVHGLVGQLGVTTAGMDGPALMGLPTMYLTQAPNDRLGRWVGTVPGYQEVVRDDTYLSRVDQTLKGWAGGAEPISGDP